MKKSVNFLPSMLLILLMGSFFKPLIGVITTAPVNVDVGVILDLNTLAGKMSNTCISMALEDFYATHNYKTKIVPHIRDTKSDVVEAAFQAIHLIKNVEVQAIVGPQYSTQADFVIDIGNKSEIPIVSPASSPSFSPKKNPYFVRVAQRSSSQVKAIAAITEAHGWRQVVLIYEDNEFGSGPIPYLSDALLDVGTRVQNRSVFPQSATDDFILKELYRLMTMQTRVFVVHVLPDLASRLFMMAEKAGMMSKGYVWIITDVLTNLLGSLESKTVDSMHGVIGLRPNVPESKKLADFNKRWKKRFHKENPELDWIELDVYGLWAYDTIFALAMAIEESGFTGSQFKRFPTEEENLTSLAAAMGRSVMGPKLLSSIWNKNIKGLSGDFRIVNGQLQPTAFQIVNIIRERRVKRICFWTEKHGLSKVLNPSNKKGYTAKQDDLRAIVWPGDSNVVPKGWQMPVWGKKLRVVVPVKEGFEAFVKVTENPQTKAILAEGFCIQIFEEILKLLPYPIPFEYIPFKINDTSDYDTLAHAVSMKEYEVVIGDITITAKRSNSVDFTFPFAESSISMIVPFKPYENKRGWIFLEPLREDLWFTTAAFFILTGFVVWVLEHRVNNEFRGPPGDQVGMILWYSFSTLVFAHKEKVISNLTRFVVIVWVFAVLVLSSSYTASLTSMLTVQQLQPTVTDMNDLIKRREPVGYQKGSFIADMLSSSHESITKSYSTFEEYDDALSKGSNNGGVAAIIDELPYAKLFLAKYCSKYTIVGPIYEMAGLGFAFPKGSPLVADFSRAILYMTEVKKMEQLSKVLGEEADCPEQRGFIATSGRLSFSNFSGLFLIAGTSLSAALFIYLFIFLNENKAILISGDSIWEKLFKLAKKFDEKKEIKNYNKDKRETTMAPENVAVDQRSADTTILQITEGEFLSQEEGFSTTEPGTPAHEIIVIEDEARER